MTDSKQDLREFSDEELSLIVMNDEGLYNMRHRSQFLEMLNDLFIFNDEQLAVLEQDVKDDCDENERSYPMWLWLK